jgi:uncharacterized protein (TIGR03437 family)
MKRTLLSFTLLLMVCAGVQAQTTTITVNGTLSLVGFSFSGTAALSGGITGSGSIAIPALTAGASGAFTGPFTITLSGGTLTGTVSVPSSILTGSGNISLTVSGGTGSYTGASGTFASLTGTAAFSGTSVTLTNYTGSGTITLGGGGGGPTANTPVITAVLDAASYTKSIAQGSIFVVKGSNLSPSGLTQFSFPLPTTSGTATGNVKITFTPTAGGAGTDAYLVYLYNQSNVNQLAAILPSALATGNYNVTVTNNGTASATFAATVVQRKARIITQDSTGTGLAVVQNFVSQTQLDVDRFTTQTISGITVSPSKPGQVLIAWLTGMGPVTGGDNTASPGFDFSANGVDVQVLVGGTSIKPLYAGRAPGLAGADQINFVLPANVTTACTVPLQVSVNGQLSDTTFIAIAPSTSATACVDPNFTAAQLTSLDQGGSYNVGAFTLSQIAESVPQVGNVKLNSIGGSFTRITGFQLSSAGRLQTVATNACQVYHIVGSQNQLGAVVSPTNLDAGTITLTGPSGSNLTSGVALNKDASTKAYSLSLGFEGAGLPPIPGQISATLVAGKYSLHGAGGPDVGVFDTSVTLGSPLTITGGLPSTVVRANGLPLAWSGGNSSDIVQIFGYAGTTSGSGANITVDAWEFICTTTAGTGGFTVPSSILNQLPAITAAQISAGTGTGALEVLSTATPGTFKAPLTAGGTTDAGYFSAFLGQGTTPAYQ